MFESVQAANPGSTLSFTFEGETVTAQPGMSVAAALLAAGIVSLRDTPVSGSPRGPFCMMGACYDCLVSVEGVCVQACLTPVREGLVVSRVAVLKEDV